MRINEEEEEAMRFETGFVAATVGLKLSKSMKSSKKVDMNSYRKSK